MPPEKCQLCGIPIINVFVDCLVRIGPKQQGWADVCTTCHKKYGFGLGTGLGQEWWRNPTTDKFYKIDG